MNDAVFENLAAHKAWRESEAFAEHLGVIRPYIEEAAPGMYEIIYSGGQIS